MKITFYGAAREVTGSCYLIETGAVRFLVDCGMFQGGREAPARNRRPFDFDPRALDFVLLTHAHIDHSGLLPKLMLEGFTGPIHATGATADLLAVMLPDSGHIQEVEAERALRKQKSSRRAGVAATPIYTVQDAMDCLEQLSPLVYDQWMEPHADIRCRFHDAGHILGSAIIEIQVTEGGKTTTLVFSGDLGQPGRPILRDPAVIEAADVLFIESTYGNRMHKDLPATLEELAQVIERTLRVKHGNVIIPAFAVGRTQEVIYYLHQLVRQGRLRDLDIFVDSPMATAATRITMQHMALFDDEARHLADWRSSAGSSLPNLHFIGSVDESMALNQIRSGAIIISASGMCDAGRIKHHLRHNLGRAECSVLITGFQAQGTLGRRLVDGVKRVRIFGQDIPVRAPIHTLGGFSAHADQRALLDWAGGFRRPPRQTFVVHGEEAAALAFAERLRTDNGWTVTVPEPGQSVTL
ncbi:MAG TPA: MBL fold metallo-hydrolase [Thiobacillus sp.]|jgi:metallo-beta-lactamase family protein|nr:MBL fold metallo-hydrolase [Thiobacillus sp.]